MPTLLDVGFASLGGLLGLVLLPRQQRLGSKLLLGLVVAVGDESVEEAVGATGAVALGLCALDLTVEVAGGLLINVVLVVLLVEVGCVVVSISCDKGLRVRQLG